MQKVSSVLQENIDYIKDYFENSADLYCKNLAVAGNDCCVCMCEDLTDTARLYDMYLNPMGKITEKQVGDNLFDYLANSSAIPVNTELLDNFTDITKALTGGTAVMFAAGDTRAMAMQAPGYPTRGIDKPTNENNLRGTKESFMDSGRKNMALIRRRIRSKNLCIETFQVGEKTQTEITVYHHKDYCPQKLYDYVTEKIKNTDLPMVFESGYLSPFVDKTRFSLFTSCGFTERPDTFCAKLCEGRVGVIVDGTPYALVYPYKFNDNFNAGDDYAQRPYFAAFTRIMRYIAFVLSVALPGFYVAFASYAPQTLVNKLLFSIYYSQNKTPLPLFREAAVICLLFEVIKEAGLRMPGAIGNSVSLVAALIIGDAAVSAGIIGNAVLIVCAMSVATSFMIPSFYEPITLFRLVFITLAGLFGIAGVSMAFIILIINVLNVDSFDDEYVDTDVGSMDKILKDSLRNL